MTFPSHGRELAGFLFRPPGEGPFPLMVTKHGSSIAQGTQNLCRPGVAALLMSWGVAIFLPHRRGYGDSPGAPWCEDVRADYGIEDDDRARDQRAGTRVLRAAAGAGALRPHLAPRTRCRRDDAAGDHGDEHETSVMLVLAPGQVRMDKAVEDYGDLRSIPRSTFYTSAIFDATRRPGLIIPAPACAAIRASRRRRRARRSSPR